MPTLVPGFRACRAARQLGAPAGRTVVQVLLGLFALQAPAAPLPDPLTPEERLWLQQHGPLRYAPHFNAPPLEMRGITNSVGGMVPDLVRAMATNLGFQVQWVLTRRSPLEAITDGEADFAGAWAATRERRDRFLFTTPFHWASNVFFVRSDSAVGRREDLRGKRVGVVRGYAAHDWLESQPWDGEVVPVASSREGLLLLSMGGLEAMFETEWVGRRVSLDAGLLNIRPLAGSPFATPQQFVVAGGNERLRAILQKAQDSLSHESMRRILEVWAKPEPSRESDLPPWLRSLLWAGAVAAAGLAAWVLTLRREVARRTRELRNSEARFRALVERARDAILVADIETGRILEANPAAAWLWGWPVEELIGKHFTELVSAADRERAIEGFQSQAAQGSVLEQALQTRDGRRILVEVSGTPALLADGRRVLQGVFRDISRRKNAEASAQRHEQFITAIAQSSPDLIVVFDLELGRPVYHNRGFTELLGYSPGEAEALGDEPMRRLLHPDDAPPMSAHFARLAQAAIGQVLCLDYRMLKKGGDYAWFRSRDTPFKRNAEGRVVQFLSVTQDITEGKRLEAELSQAYERFKRLFLSSPLGAALISLSEERFLDVNERFLEQSGWTRDEVVGRTVREVGVWCDWSQRTELFARVQREQVVRNFQARLRNQSGEEFDVLLEAQIVQLPGGPALLTQGADVTERRRMESILRESEEKYRVIFQSGSQAFYLMTDVFVDCNEQACRVWACSREDIIGRSPAEFSPKFQPDGRPSDTAARGYIEAARRGAPQRFYWQHYRKDGVLLDCEITLDAVSVGGRPLLLVSLTDITARRQAELALAEKERFVSTVAANTPDYIVVYDLDLHRSVYRNKDLPALLGYTVAEALDLEPGGLFRLMHPEDLPRFQAHLQRLAGEPNHAVLNFEYRMRRKDGAYGWFLGRDSVFKREAGGRVTQILSVTQDITERKRAEEVRAQLEGQLRQAQKMEAVGQLAGGVAHDFNNILTAFSMSLELVRQEAGLPPAVRTGLADLVPLVERAASLTRQLLLFARRERPHRRVLDLNSLLGNLLKMLGRLIGEHISLDFQGVRQSLWVDADPGMLEQVVTNLVVNARDAMPQGGRIELRARREAVDAAHVASNPEAREGEWVCLSVSDNGCGMDSATRQRIFEPFFTTKEIGKGTGLGLSTVYGIVQQHQGWIEVDSSLDQGATFRVYFPPATTPESGATADETTERLAGGNETILVVEDETAVRRLLVRSLERHGYRVLQAVHGREALALWTPQVDRIDLLLSDVVMPEGLGGFELAEQLRKRNPLLKVMLISGYSAELMSHGFEVPAGTAFFQKPFAPGELLRRVRELLDA